MDDEGMDDRWRSPGLQKRATPREQQQRWMAKPPAHLGVSRSPALEAGPPLLPYVAHHHHHVLLWSPHGLSVNPAAIPTHGLSDHNVDSGHRRHFSTHVVEHQPIHVIVSTAYADKYNHVPKVSVASLVAGTNSAVYFVKGKPVFLHQFVHYHLIHCETMWPPRSGDDDHGDPAPRLFFTEVSVLTQTKTITNCHYQLDPISEFKHHHAHLHTCTVKIDACRTSPPDNIECRLL